MPVLLPICRLLLCTLLLALGLPREAVALPEGFRYENVIEGLQLPTAVQFSRDGRVFIAEKRGVIKVYDDLLDSEPTVFADLRTKVHANLDRGLLGLALHPDFPDVPYVYVSYTYDGSINVDDAPRWGAPDGDDDPCPDSQGCPASGRLSRLTAAGNVAIEETVLIRDWYLQFPTHALDGIGFGADGYLYVASGEGASGSFVDTGQLAHPLYPDPFSPPGAGGALRSQGLETGSPSLAGTIIRVDPATGEAAPGNPLVADADLNARRIVAYGLRNPFRFAFRPGTNEMWIGDVGWELAEEINVLPDPATSSAPANFGWPCYEGVGRQAGYEAAELPICQALYAGSSRFPYVPPWRDFVRPEHAESEHEITAASIAALSFYDGPNYPGRYRNALFFADFVAGRIYAALDLDGDGVPDGPDTIEVFADGAWGLVALERGPSGDLFFPSLFSGRLVRIRYGDNTPPVAALEVDADSDWQGPPRTVGFDAGGSYDPDNPAADALSFAWDLSGNGAFDDVADPTASTASRAFSDDGSYWVSVRVTDADGASDVASLRITVGDAVAQAQITSPALGHRWRSGETLILRGSGSEADGSALPESAYQWSVILLHCVTGPDDCHQHPMTGGSGSEVSLIAPEHDYPSYLQVTLNASTADGVLTRSRRLDPQTALVTLDTEPSGMSLAFGSGSQATPFQREVIVGSSFSVGAPSVQQHGGHEWNFVAWSNGGARQHTTKAEQSGSMRLTASYASSTEHRVFRDGFEAP
jgi:glucose/arabinose dehydrogenase